MTKIVIKNGRDFVSRPFFRIKRLFFCVLSEFSTVATVVFFKTIKNVCRKNSAFRFGKNPF